MALKPLTRLRRICLALPQAYEQETWGDATFRVRGKMILLIAVGIFEFARAYQTQQVLVNADPRRFYVPPYVGHKGWVGVRLDGKPDWDEIARIVERSYRLVAPRRLVKS